MSITPDAPSSSAEPGPVPGPLPDVGASDDAAVVAPARRRRLLLTLTFLAVGVLLIDQVSKVWAESALVAGERTPLIGSLLGLSLVHNAGAALSIATGLTWVLTAVATTVVVVVIRASRRIGSTAWSVALGLLLGGALGNLADRFLREPGVARGHVVDFIAYGNVFVGNVADIAIVGAAGLVVILALRGIALDGSRASAATDAGVESHATESRATESHATESRPADSQSGGVAP